MFGQIFEGSGIPLLIGGVCLYFAYRVMILKDTKALRGKDKAEPEDKEGYCADAGKLLIFFAAGSFLMGILETINPVAAFIQTVVWIVATFILWKKINNKYF